MPPLPEMEMSAIERDLFEYFLDAYHQEYPDLIATDHILLHLAALEYIKLLRMIAQELKSGQLVTMSRQSPAVNMRGLLDQLSVTRRARVANKKDANTEDERELREMFMAMSQGRKPSAN
jgi:predicted TPR repeat methyltransferase